MNTQLILKTVAAGSRDGPARDEPGRDARPADRLPHVHRDILLLRETHGLDNAEE